jgi:hypothetical protein
MAEVSLLFALTRGNMKPWSQLQSWLRTLLRRLRMKREMEAELRFHIAECAEDLARRGVRRQEAPRQARIEFAGFERAKEECREARGVNFTDSLLEDLRFGLRAAQ